MFAYRDGMSIPNPLAELSPYELKRWRSLQAHWKTKAERKNILPPKVRTAVAGASATTRDALRTAGRKVAELTPEPVKHAGGAVIDSALEPTVRAVVALVDLATDWVVELNDPEAVFRFHRERGRDVTTLVDLRALDLAELDEFSRRFSLRWRTLGALEGGAMGALGFVPIVGTLVSVPADAVVVHLLSTGLATRSAYTYGLDAQDDEQRHHLERMVRNSYAEQAAKASAVHNASKAYGAGKGRVRWSKKLRDDHRISGCIREAHESRVR